MPWASTERPSLALSTLAALAERDGHSCAVLYANLRFAAESGVHAYELLADETSFFGLDEHVFAVDVFGPSALDSERYLSGLLGSRTAAGGDHNGTSLEQLRDFAVPRFLERTAQSLVQSRPHIVGLTCTFNQTMPSLALARRVKLLDPGIKVILGGPSVHDSMGIALAETFPTWIDHIFTGEADESFPAYLRQYANETNPVCLPGVTTGGTLPAPAPLIHDLDSIPVPAYDAYFDERSHLVSNGSEVGPFSSLPYESSRGCWWGAKHHCTFCGLNNMGMRYRSRSDQKIEEDLIHLSEKYHVLSFMAADNILDHRAYGGLLRRLSDAAPDFNLFYEIKANVKRHHVHALAAAGVSAVQPGVESFSDHVLHLMDKGVTGLQNVQMLKWMQEYSIDVIYNVLVGFPGETADDYREMLRIIRSIKHLPAPSGNSSVVEVHRFSPFFDSPRQLGIGAIRPAAFYRHLIPPEILDPTRYAFFFDRTIPEDLSIQAEMTALNNALSEWREGVLRRKANLGASFVEIITTRDGVNDAPIILTGLDALLFVTLDQERSLDRLVRTIVVPSVEPASIVSALHHLQRVGLVLESNGRWLTVVPYARIHSESEPAQWLDRNGWTVKLEPVGTARVRLDLEPIQAAARR